MNSVRAYLATRLFIIMMMIAPNGSGGVLVCETHNEIGRKRTAKKLSRAAMEFAVEGWPQ